MSTAHTTITFTFRTGKKGHYRWQCFVPCAAGFVLGFGGPMQSIGYMDLRPGTPLREIAVLVINSRWHSAYPTAAHEKRGEYTRTRMVQLAPYLVADSVESYRTDSNDGDSVEAVFSPGELDEAIAFQRSIPSDLMTLLRGLGVEEGAHFGDCPVSPLEGVLAGDWHPAGFQRVDRRLRRGVGRDHDHRRLRVLRLDLAQEVEPRGIDLLRDDDAAHRNPSCRR